LTLLESGEERVPTQQVSVFLDNHPGSLSEVMSLLDKNQIKIFALSIADAGEFGLVRMITENPEKATNVLEDAEFNLAKSKKNIEVTVILPTDGISRITKILGDSGLNIEYAYSSAVHMNGKFALVLRVNDLIKAETAFKQNNITILTLEEIQQFSK
jgi:hypothetical protein